LSPSPFQGVSNVPASERPSPTRGEPPFHVERWWRDLAVRPAGDAARGGLRQPGRPGPPPAGQQRIRGDLRCMQHGQPRLCPPLQGLRSQAARVLCGRRGGRAAPSRARRSDAPVAVAAHARSGIDQRLRDLLGRDQPDRGDRRACTCRVSGQ